MPQKTMIPVRSAEGVKLSRPDLRLIRRAAGCHPDAAKLYGLVVRRRLDEGYSSARVLEAEWLSEEGAESRWSVLKLDRIGLLAREGKPSATHLLDLKLTKSDLMEKAG